MRKIVLSTALGLVLAACGGGNETPSSTSTPAALPATDDTAPETALESASQAVENATETVTDAVEDVSDNVSETIADVTDNAANAIEEATKKAAETVEQSAEEAELAIKLAALPAPYNEADLKKGARLYKQCSACHLLEEGAPNRVGPNLYGVVNSEAGHVESFNYSPAMKDSGLVWDTANLESYLENPRTFLKGNRMSFAGLRKPNDRRDVIAYIMLNGGVAE